MSDAFYPAILPVCIAYTEIRPEMGEALIPNPPCIGGTDGVSRVRVNRLMYVVDASKVAELNALMATVAAGGGSTGVAQPAFEPAVAGQYYGFAFATTVMIWAFAYGAGQVIRMVRKG